MPSIISALSYQYQHRTNTKNNLKLRLANADHGDPRFMTPPDSFKKKYTVEAGLLMGRPVYYFNLEKAVERPCVLYFHGGAFVTALQKRHWRLTDSILRETCCPVVVPDYPLIPEHTHKRIFHFCMELYTSLLERCPRGLILMGDSAGANLAMAVSQAAVKQGLPAPKKLLLLSPFLDATSDNPVKNVLAQRDPVLDPAGGREAAILYAGSLPLNDPRISPILGSMKGLPKVYAWTGDNDMLYADALLLKQKLHKAHVPYHIYIYPGMVHNWMLHDLPEGRTAVRQIVSKIG